MTCTTLKPRTGDIVGFLDFSNPALDHLQYLLRLHGGEEQAGGAGRRLNQISARCMVVQYGNSFVPDGKIQGARAILEQRDCVAVYGAEMGGKGIDCHRNCRRPAKIVELR